MSEDLYDVVIVGGGISGLTAAYRLLQYDRSLKLLLLEAKDRVGGRTLTTKLKCENGEDSWDLGGQWIGSSQVHVMELVKELGLDIHQQYNKGAKFARLSDGRLRKYSSSLPKISLWSLLDMHLFINKTTMLSKEISLKESNNLRKRLDSQTLESYKQSHCWTKEAKELLDSACGVIFGAHPSQISLLFFLNYCNCAGGVEPLLESGQGSAQEWRIQGGAQTISHKLLEMIGRERVWFQEAVMEINQENSNTSIKIVTTKGKRVSSKFLVMAIPPHQAMKINFNPNLPFNKEHLILHMPVGHVIKFVITYATFFWRENGLSGEVVSFDSFKLFENDVSSKKRKDNVFSGEAPVSLVYDATSANGNAALVGFISGVAATQWTHKSEEEQRNGVVEFLKKFFGNEAENYIDFAIKDWCKEPWNGGGPVNYTTPGTLSIYGSCLKDPVGRIHWAGTETATVWSGFMNGAVQSGSRVANEVLQRLYPHFIPIYQDKFGMDQGNFKSSKNSLWTTGILSTLFVVGVCLGIGYFTAPSALFKFKIVSCALN